VAIASSVSKVVRARSLVVAWLGALLTRLVLGHLGGRSCRRGLPDGSRLPWHEGRLLLVREDESLRDRLWRTCGQIARLHWHNRVELLRLLSVVPRCLEHLVQGGRRCIHWLRGCTLVVLSLVALRWRRFRGDLFGDIDARHFLGTIRFVHFLVRHIGVGLISEVLEDELRFLLVRRSCGHQFVEPDLHGISHPFLRLTPAFRCVQRCDDSWVDEFPVACLVRHSEHICVAAILSLVLENMVCDSEDVGRLKRVEVFNEQVDVVEQSVDLLPFNDA